MMPPAPLRIPGDRRAALQQAVQREQKALNTAFDRLGNAVHTKADVRHNIIERPYAWLAGGLLIGLWWGLRKA